MTINKSLASTMHNIINKCYNSKEDMYSYYGGQGVRVCSEWLDSDKSFIKWAKDNGFKLGMRIIRIDKDGNYTPDNCYVGTIGDSSRSRRNIIWLTIDGRKRTLADWCKIHGAPYTTSRRRYLKGVVGVDIFKKENRK